MRRDGRDDGRDVGSDGGGWKPVHKGSAAIAQNDGVSNKRVVMTGAKNAMGSNSGSFNAIDPSDSVSSLPSSLPSETESDSEQTVSYSEFP